MKHKLLKPLLGCLLVATLLACAKTEEVAAQEKQKTLKDLLCRKWRLVNAFHGRPIGENENFVSVFYPDHTFSIEPDTAWHITVNNKKTITGRWELVNPQEENTPCFFSNGEYYCLGDFKIVLWTNEANKTSYSSFKSLFNNTLHLIYQPGVEIRRLSNNFFNLGVVHSALQPTTIDLEAIK